MVDFLSILTDTAGNPWIYLPLFFAFSVAATVALPVPVEIGLLNPLIPPWPLIVTLGLGKAVGAFLVLPFGAWIGARIDREVVRYPRFALFYDRLKRWMEHWGYLALFAILSVPFMSDTAPVYAFSTMTDRSRGAREGTGSVPAPNGTRTAPLRAGPFVLVALGAGLVRGALFLALPVLLGWP